MIPWCQEPAPRDRQEEELSSRAEGGWTRGLGLSEEVRHEAQGQRGTKTGAGDSQLIPFLGMSHLPPLPVPYFHKMLKASDAQRAVGFQGGPEDPHWLHVCLGKVGRVVSREEELGSPWGKCRKPPARLWNPKQSCTPPSRATNQHGHEPHDPSEKAATATRWQAEPSIPAQVTVPGRKTQSWWNNPRCPAPLCSSTSRDIPLPCISIWRTIHGATSSHHGAKPLGIQKTLEFQLFHTNSEEELPGSHPCPAPLLGGRGVFHSIPQHCGVSSLPRITLISAQLEQNLLCQAHLSKQGKTREIRNAFARVDECSEIYGPGRWMEPREPGAAVPEACL